MSTRTAPTRDDSVQVSLGRLREIEEQRISEERAEAQRREEAQRRAREAEQRALRAQREAQERAQREAQERRAREEAEQQRHEEQQRRREELEERLRREALRQRALVDAELRLERARLATAGGSPARSSRGRRLLLGAALLLAVGLVAFLVRGWSGAAARAHQRRLELIALAGQRDAKRAALRHAQDALLVARQRESSLQHRVDELQHELLAAQQRPAGPRQRRRTRGASKPQPSTPPVIRTRCSDSDDPIDCIKTRGGL